MPLRNSDCFAAWRKAGSSGAREAVPLLSGKEAVVPWALPRAQWLRPDLNDPFITHRKWVWTLHTGRWLVPPTRCRKPFQGNGLKCLNIPFLSLLFLWQIPQFEWEPLFASWSGCSIFWIPRRIFHLYAWQLQYFIGNPTSFRLLQHCCGGMGLSQLEEITQWACCFYSWKWTNIIKNNSSQLSWVQLHTRHYGSLACLNEREDKTRRHQDKGLMPWTSSSQHRSRATAEAQHSNQGDEIVCFSFSKVDVSEVGIPTCILWN